MVEVLRATDTEERNQLMKALRVAGWTLQSIGAAAEVSRERVRQVVEDTELEPYYESATMPQPPLKAAKAKPQYVEPQPETLAELLRLKPLAEQVRANSPEFRDEAEAYTKLLWHAHKPIAEGGEGVTIYRLAKRLGVTHGAVRFRFVRYGYLKAKTGESKVYRPIKQENRAI